MLKRLVIANYALIDHLDIDFHDGLSIITGETGAGKSIILGALSLIFGQRADSKIIRNASNKSIIEAYFDIQGYELESFFAEQDLDYIEDECILRREIAPNGRSRAFINDSLVTLSVLADLASRLVDIHSQHNNALLLSPSYQLKIIDNVACNGELTGGYVQLYNQYAHAVTDLEKVKEKIEKSKADEEYYRFQLRQFKELMLSEGEQETLESERTVLSNVTEIKQSLKDACDMISDNDVSILSMMSQVVNRISSLKTLYDQAETINARLDSVSIEITDIYDTLSHTLNTLEDDPEELERVEERLSAIYALQQKYHVGTDTELIEIQHKLEHSLEEIAHSDDEIQIREQQLEAYRKELQIVADRLTLARQKAARQMSERLIALAKPLGMKNLRCEIELIKVPFERTGQDKIRFMFAFNKNQDLMPIEKTASGGEVSRLMLCLKSIVAESTMLPSIIFDEVDTGVSGEVANKIGLMMKQISDRIQVIAITHLPQVAALGEHHYKVYKTDDEHATVTNIKELDKEGRIREIAGMLSGATIDDAAINNAKSLLNL